MLNYTGTTAYGLWTMTMMSNHISYPEVIVIYWGRLTTTCNVSISSPHNRSDCTCACYNKWSYIRYLPIIAHLKAICLWKFTWLSLSYKSSDKSSEIISTKEGDCGNTKYLQCTAVKLLILNRWYYYYVRIGGLLLLN